MAEVETQTLRCDKTSLLLHVFAQHFAQGIMENMRRRVVASNSLTALCIDSSRQRSVEVCRQFGQDMYGQVILAFGIQYAHIAERTGIAYLTTHFGVERCLVEHHLIERFAFLAHLTVAKNAACHVQFVIADKLRLTFGQHGPVAKVLFIRLATHGFLVLKGFVVLLLVGGKAVLAEDEFRQVERKSVGIFEREHIHAADLFLTGLAHFVHQFVQQTYTFIERTQERLFFGLDDRRDLRLLGFQFRIGLAEVRDELRHELIEESRAHVEEGIAIAHGAAEDTTDDITRFLVRRQLSVSDGESDRTDMIGDDAHGDVGLLVLAVGAMTDLADLLQHRLEDIGVVVRGLTLDGTHETLEAHAGIDDLLCQGLQGTVRFAVELHEDDIPDLDDLRVVLINQLASGHFGAFLGRTAVHVDLRTRTARTCLTHLPEVIMLVAVQDMIGRQVL